MKNLQPCRHDYIIVKIYRHNTYKNKYSTNKKQIKQKNVKVEIKVEVTCVRREGGGTGSEKILSKSICFHYIFYR